MKRPFYPNIWIGSRPVTAKGREPIVAFGRFGGMDPLKQFLNGRLLEDIGEKGGGVINIGCIEVSCCKLIIPHSLSEPEVNLRETEDDW